MKKENVIQLLEKEGYAPRINPNTNDTIYAKSFQMMLNDFTYIEAGNPESGIKWLTLEGSGVEYCWAKVTVIRTKANIVARLHKSSYDEDPLEIGKSYGGSQEYSVLDADGELIAGFDSAVYATLFNRANVTAEEATGLSFADVK